jgi:hydroxypyruvate isomerase
MFPLCFNSNGLRIFPLERAIQVIGEAGYRGIEISLHPAHIDPLNYTEQEILIARAALERYQVEPVCVATGAPNLLSTEDYEPSFIAPGADGRRQRIDLMRRSFDLARKLSVPTVNMSSGFLKPEVSEQRAWDYLVEGISACLEDVGDLILAIEPEPKMFVETSTQAVELIRQIDSPRFKLNLDVGHVNSVEDDFLDSIRRSVPYTRHIHIEDIKGRVHFHLIPGEGDIDFASVFQVLASEGYSHWVSVELYPHADRWQESLNQSYDILQGAIAASERAAGAVGD